MKMRIAAATSLKPDFFQATREVSQEVVASLGGVPPDLAFVFVSGQHIGRIDGEWPKLAESLGPGAVLGATAEAVIGGRLEHEGHAAVSVWAASLGGIKIPSSHITLEATPDGMVFVGCPALPSGPSTVILLGDPFTFDPEAFVARMEDDNPEVQVLGGMASAGAARSENRLLLGARVLEEGAVAVVLPASVRVRPVVSQGCRPFGRRFVVTKAEQNLLVELGGRPALEKLGETLRDLSPEDRHLVENGLHLGMAIDARKSEHRQGDFLVRNILGFMPDRRALVVTDVVKPGTTVQFHMRDARSAGEDLHVLLRQAREDGCRPEGSLLFSCNGRGSRLFGEPHHDASAVLAELGDAPLAGFFAAGEIGPVGGRSFLHGFTASLALFESVPSGVASLEGDGSWVGRAEGGAST